jgi:2-isopropylmalate synthase
LGWGALGGMATTVAEPLGKKRKLGSEVTRTLSFDGDMPIEKYRRYRSWYKIPFDDKWPKREWPNKEVTEAPRWCSVDLRDGNQALVNPMNHEKKLRLFMHLLKLGYKEIEVGFPSASQTDFDFIRYIIDNGLVPDDVYIQVLTQARDSLIRRTIEGVRGAKNVVLHIYNSTSELQRRVVFGLGKEEIKNMAVQGTKLLKSLAEEHLKGVNVRLEYSPESFTGTELDFALDVCEAVCDTWGATPENKVILNLPSTVEMCTPNVYADQIEWMCSHISRRDSVCISLHPHNDRGTGIAATELALMAGADRVEGCLFGNGERTGNVCLVTLALNLFTQGIDPGVRYNNIQETIEVAEFCTELKVPERYPWAGSLVYTAFSGSHQDAIKKGLAALGEKHWEVPYLPIDPEDLGRHYEAIIRVNSQSGKGGISYLLETAYGIALPKEAQAEFAQVVQKFTDKVGREITSKEIYDSFVESYIELKVPLELVGYETLKDSGENCVLSAKVRVGGEVIEVKGEGNGPVSAFVHGINKKLFGPQRMHVSLSDYQSVARSKCKAAEGSEAVCTVRCQAMVEGSKQGAPKFGVGLHGNTTTAVLRAVLSALNRIGAAGDTKMFDHVGKKA